MRYWRGIFSTRFVLFVALALLHQLLEKLLNVRLSLIDSYLDPVLLMPILLHLMLWERRILFRKGVLYVFTFFQVAVVFVVVSFIAEFLFPRWHVGFTADWWDVACYAFGAVIFYYFFNLPYRVKQ